MKHRDIPQEDLYVALLDDDPKYSCRPLYIDSFAAHFGQPKEENCCFTDDIKKFMAFAKNHKNAVLFCDPGALGACMAYHEDYKNDRIMAKWLEDNPSRTLHVPYLLTVDYYSFRTFELKHSVNFFGSEFQWHINQIFYKWLFEHNPLALFVDEFGLDCAHKEYIKKLKEPVLTKICEKFGLKGKYMKDRKQAIDKYFLGIWKQEMKRRGVKGY